jgi:hypothetical protein
VDVCWIGDLLEFFEDHLRFLNFLLAIAACGFHQQIRCGVNV